MPVIEIPKVPSPSNPASLPPHPSPKQQSTCVPSYLANPPAGTDINTSSFMEFPTATAESVTISAAGVSSSATTMTPVCLHAAAMLAIVRCLDAGTVASSSSFSSGEFSGDVGKKATAGQHQSGRGATIAAQAAAVVACCCRREEERDLAIAAGAPERLLSLLLESERPDTQVRCRHVS